MVIFLTGVGTRLLFETMAMRHEVPAFVQALARTTVVVRGPKPAAVLREYGVPVTIAVPEPNTWREIVQTLDEHERGVALDGRRVAIQEYGEPNDRLVQALTARGADVRTVPVYRWALPEDLGPLIDGIRALVDGRAEVAVFTSAQQVQHVLRVAREQNLEAALRRAWPQRIIASVGPMTSQMLRAQDLGLDFEPTHPKMGVLIDELARQLPALRAAKASAVGTMPGVARVPAPGTAQPIAASAPAPSDVDHRRNSLFLRACRREPTDVTPVWLMRQAGRYMPSYRTLRNRVSFLELCKRPELAAQVTVEATQALGVDAAIIFSDILLIVESLGLELEYTAEDGPVISGDVASSAAIDRLPELDPQATLPFVYDAIRLTRGALDAGVPLIGFAGAPFTLAAYILEGGASKTFLQTKRLMYTDAGAWRALMERLARGLARHLNAQIDAGADAVQLFDSWVGCLGPEDYRAFVLPHVRSLIAALRPSVPVVHFATGNPTLLPLLREAGGDVIGVDFRVELDRAWESVGRDVGVQGNLDPAVLCGPRPLIRERARRILDQAGGRAGHIFNLGHGVLPATPVDHAVALVDAVHELSRRAGSSTGGASRSEPRGGGRPSSPEVRPPQARAPRAEG
jgi:uroporphyrinogen decarboxylase